jgi:hypothetical protein
MTRLTTGMLPLSTRPARFGRWRGRGGVVAPRLKPVKAPVSRVAEALPDKDQRQQPVGFRVECGQPELQRQRHGSPAGKNLKRKRQG